MPIVFILSGIVLIVILFDVFKIKKSHKNFIIFQMLLIIVGYFLTPGNVGEIYFNSLHVATVVTLLILTCSQKAMIKTISITIIVGVFYYLLLNDNSIFLLAYNRAWVVGAISIMTTLFVSINTMQVIFFSVILSTVIACINVHFDILEFTFSSFDSEFILITMYVSLLFNLIKISINNMKPKKTYSERVYYEKKNFNFCYVNINDTDFSI